VSASGADAPVSRGEWLPLPLHAWRETKDTLALAPRSVADFYREAMAALRVLGVDVRIHPTPVELAEVIPFDRDEIHGAYDADAARRLCFVSGF